MFSRTEIILSLLLIVVVSVSSSAHTAEPIFTVGVCTHFIQNKGIPVLNMASMTAAGITAIRDEAYWSGIEREKGTFIISPTLERYVEEAWNAGIDVLMVLDYANRNYDNGDKPKSPEAINGYCRYAEFLANHFKGKIRWYEIWNEYDIGIGMRAPYNKGGSPEDYVRMLKAVYLRLKKIDPTSTVITGACADGGLRRGWLEGIVKLGALEYCDAISFHPYCYGDPFPERTPDACVEWIGRTQTMLRSYSGGKDVPIYVTEVGWPSHLGRRSAEPELAASYLARLYLLARTEPWFKGLWWYDFQDDGWNPAVNEDNFGIVRPDLTPKPSYYVLANIADLVVNGQFTGRITTPDNALTALSFELGGLTVWALWSSDDKDRQVLLHTASKGNALEIRECGHKAVKALWGYRAWFGERSAELQPNQVSILVGPRPVLVSGNLEGVTINEVLPRFREAKAE
ncbi:hypothetical protein ACFL1R_04255 [Candidatus Latescibacterota bacterium]